MSSPFKRPPTGRELRRQAARAERIAAARPRPPERRVVRDANAQLLELARPFEPGEKIADHIKTRLAFNALKSGAGTHEDFLYLSTTMGVLFWRAVEIDAALAAVMKRGALAMQSCWRRRQATGRFGFSGPELVDLAEAIDTAEAITDASTPLQLINAACTAHRHGEIFRS
ncbi:hypothetical protein [Pulveribacter sp.]|uniref:hypothetical protein n=1 Tax=Pulveribacter sp. TaxID=2678893 RepID=UPI0028A71169|nr:hypothetical protein [Pulveribacter sp.]